MDRRLRNGSGKIRGPGGRLGSGVVFVASWLLVSSVAGAAFVTYLRAYGDWSVSCATDEPTHYRWCTLQAPPPQLYDGRSEVAVMEVRDGDFVVAVRILEGVRGGAPVYLRIDANPPYRAEPSRVGEAAWRGAEAAALVGELRTGRNMVLRSFPLSGGPPRDEHYSLELFGEALGEYRARRRDH